MQIEAVNHVVGYVLSLLLCDLCGHNRRILVKLLGIGAYDLSFDFFRNLDAEFGFADCRCAYNENS